MRVHELVAALQHLPADAVVHQVVVEPSGDCYDRVAGVVQTVDVALDESGTVAGVWLVADSDGSPQPPLLGVVCRCGARVTITAAGGHDHHCD